MYKTLSEHQISIFDFKQSCGTPLDENNEWIRLADAIDWTSLEKAYSSLFPSHEGRQAFPLRVALGALIISEATGGVLTENWLRKLPRTRTTSTSLIWTGFRTTAHSSRQFLCTFAAGLIRALYHLCGRRHRL